MTSSSTDLRDVRDPRDPRDDRDPREARPARAAPLVAKRPTSHAGTPALPRGNPGDVYCDGHGIAEMTSNGHTLKTVATDEVDTFERTSKWMNVSNETVSPDYATISHLATLWFGRWITTSAIDHVLQCEMAFHLDTPEKRSGVAMMNANFYSALKDPNSYVWNLTVELFLGDLILVPVNDGSHTKRGTHWSAFVIDLNRNVIYHLDSCPGTHDSEVMFAELKRWAAHITGAPGDLSFKLEILDRGRQTNACDCGVWMICFLMKFATFKSCEFIPYVQDYVSQKRRRFAALYFIDEVMRAYAKRVAAGGSGASESTETEEMDDVEVVKTR